MRVVLGSSRALLCAGLAATLPAAPLAQSLPDGFMLESVIGEPFDGLPIGFAFLPDARVLIVEKEGNVRLTAAGADASVVVFTLAPIRTDGERGLLGIAVDPAWPARPYVYLMATHADGRSRITMHAATGDLAQPASTNLALGAAYVVLEWALDLFPNHKGGTLRFGPDGRLYASLGDDGSVCAVQDVQAYNGKLLRLDVASLPGSGSGPPAFEAIAAAGNPFAANGGGAALVFALGLRNPFRFTIDSPTGNLYIADVGAHAWEEIDEIAFAGYSGSNFGWPYYEGGAVMPGTCTEGGPPFTAPIYAYPHSDPVPLAVIAGPRIRTVATSPRSFPPVYEGDVLLHDHYSGWIRRLVGSQGTWFLAGPVPGQPDPVNWATGMGFLSDMQMGSDGAVYVLAIVDAGTVARGLHRIVHVPATDAAGAAARPDLVIAPNPQRSGGQVAVQFPVRGAHVETLRVLDAAGRVVRVLPVRRDGQAAIVWDGRDAAGRAVTPGIYLFEIRDASGRIRSGKVSVVH